LGGVPNDVVVVGVPGLATALARKLFVDIAQGQVPVLVEGDQEAGAHAAYVVDAACPHLQNKKISIAWVKKNYRERYSLSTAVFRIRIHMDPHSIGLRIRRKSMRLRNTDQTHKN
jgi:hypothetical protein